MKRHPVQRPRSTRLVAATHAILVALVGRLYLAPTVAQAQNLEVPPAQFPAAIDAQAAPAPAPPAQEEPAVLPSSTGSSAAFVDETASGSPPQEIAPDATTSASPAPPDVSAVPGEPPWRTIHPVDPRLVSYDPAVGLQLQTADGQFAFHFRTWGQMLYEVDDRWNADKAKREAVGALLMRRLRVVFAGHLFSKHFYYHLQFTVAPREVGLGQGDANAKVKQNPPITNLDNVTTLAPVHFYYVQLDASPNANVRVGQYALPYNRERMSPVRYLEFVDRSLANFEFTYDRDLGVDVRSLDLLGLDGRLRYYVGVSMGEGFSATNLTDFGYLYFARLEYVPFGKLEDYAQGDLTRRRRPVLGLSAAYLFANRAKGNRGNLGHTFADAGWANYNNATADVVFKARGWAVEAAGFVRDGTRHAGPLFGMPKVPADPSQGTIGVDPPRNGYGMTLQGGYLLPQLDLEMAGRYSLVGPIGTPGKSTAMDTGQEVTGTLSYYFEGHFIKLQGDVVRQWGAGIQNSRGAPIVELDAAGKPKTGFGQGYGIYRVQLTAGF